MPRTYEAAFLRAVYTFKHQRVYDPQSRTMVHLRPLPPRGLDPSVLTVPEGSEQPVEGAAQALDFLGPLLPQQQCFQLATGVLGVGLHTVGWAQVAVVVGVPDAGARLHTHWHLAAGHWRHSAVGLSMAPALHELMSVVSELLCW